MPTLEEHCAESISTYGQGFREVHVWLDACHDLPGCGGVAHRRKRHHEAGIAEVAHLWGPKAAEAARQHILSDLKQVGWTGPFPLNERHCERMGLWVTR
jgi:hypothetical protein